MTKKDHTGLYGTKRAHAGLYSIQGMETILGTSQGCTGAYKAIQDISGLNDVLAPSFC